jgi:chromosome segregation ATPase
MDAVNERKVFELLVKTSCRENSAQYFLLTPKLLPDLQYDHNITVLVVNNGEGMCNHKDWDINAFIAAAKRTTA